LLRPVTSPVKGQPAVAPAIVPAAVIGALLALGTAAMYTHASNFPWKDPGLVSAAPASHGEDMSAASMQEVTRQLEAKLKDNPNDAQGWRMLARTYLVTSRPKDAVEAYNRAIGIAGEHDTGLNLDLAEAMILTEDPSLQGKAQAIVDATLAAEPNNQKALWYSGVMAYRANDAETTKLRWTKLLEQNPPPDVRQIVEQQLSGLGVSVPATAAAQSTPAASAMGGGAGGTTTPQGRTIRVAVSLDPSLASRLKPGTTLFISAREPGVPGPPLAAVRLTSDELPTTVVLSDANSMMEGRNLSSVNDVEVVARVAFGGDVMTASGDLIGTAIQKKGGSEDLSVSISKVQP
jgi:cytochrome c-type biogenesis protein CcmH